MTAVLAVFKEPDTTIHSGDTLGSRLWALRSRSQMWEHDRSRPTIDVLVFLADSYGVTVDWLATGSTRAHRDGHLLIGARS